MRPIGLSYLLAMILVMDYWAAFHSVLDCVYIATEWTSPFLDLTNPEALRYRQTICLTNLVTSFIPLVFNLVPLFCLHLLSPGVRNDKTFASFWWVSCRKEHYLLQAISLKPLLLPFHIVHIPTAPALIEYFC